MAAPDPPGSPNPAELPILPAPAELPAGPDGFPAREALLAALDGLVARLTATAAEMDLRLRDLEAASGHPAVQLAVLRAEETEAAWKRLAGELERLRRLLPPEWRPGAPGSSTRRGAA